MESKPAKRGGKSTAASWFRNIGPSRAATRIATRLRTPHPVISEPFGPVHTSRGADFTRSETFLVVNGIEDCADEPGPEQLEREREHSAMISAILKNRPLRDNPSIPKHGVTVLRPPALKVSEIAPLLPQNDENTPPFASG